MTASAVDVVNERWLVIEKGAYARQLAGFGGVMDRMILGHGRRHEPSRRINHVRGIILAAAPSPSTRTRKLSGRGFRASMNSMFRRRYSLYVWSRPRPPS